MTDGHQDAARIAFAVFMAGSMVAFGRTVGVQSPWFAVVVSFSVLGLLDLAIPRFRLRVPPFLRGLRPWETRGAIYRRLGVVAFGAFLRGTPVRWLNRRVYLSAHARDIACVRTHIENAEAAHFWGSLATLPYLTLAWMRGWWISFAAVLVFNVTVNLYPILHLRLVRSRLERALIHRRHVVPLRSGRPERG